MQYSYTTMTEWWDTVKELFEYYGLLAGWNGKVHPVDPDVLILTASIRDIESGEVTSTEVPIRFNHQDFRFDGAHYSYWCRMAVIRLCGLIDSSDEDAETMDTRPSPATRGDKKGSTNSDKVIY